MAVVGNVKIKTEPLDGDANCKDIPHEKGQSLLGGSGAEVECHTRDGQTNRQHPGQNLDENINQEYERRRSAYNEMYRYHHYHQLLQDTATAAYASSTNIPGVHLQNYNSTMLQHFARNPWPYPPQNLMAHFQIPSMAAAPPAPILNPYSPWETMPPGYARSPGSMHYPGMHPRSRVPSPYMYPHQNYMHPPSPPPPYPGHLRGHPNPYTQHHPTFDPSVVARNEDQQIRSRSEDKNLQLRWEDEINKMYSRFDMQRSHSGIGNQHIHVRLRPEDQHIQSRSGDQHFQPGSEDQHIQLTSRDQPIQPRSGDQHILPRSNRHFQPRSDVQHFQPRSGGQHIQPRSGDQYIQPKSSDQHFLPRSGDQHGQPRSGDQHFQPRSGDQHIQPRSEEQHFQPSSRDQQIQSKSGDQHFQPRLGDQHFQQRSEDQHIQSNGDQNIQPRFGDQQIQPRSKDQHIKPNSEDHIQSQSEIQHMETSYPGTSLMPQGSTLQPRPASQTVVPTTDTSHGDHTYSLSTMKYGILDHDVNWKRKSSEDQFVIMTNPSKHFKSTVQPIDNVPVNKQSSAKDIEMSEEVDINQNLKPQIVIAMPTQKIVSSQDSSKKPMKVSCLGTIGQQHIHLKEDSLSPDPSYQESKLRSLLSKGKKMLAPPPDYGCSILGKELLKSHPILLEQSAPDTDVAGEDSNAAPLAVSAPLAKPASGGQEVPASGSQQVHKASVEKLSQFLSKKNSRPELPGNQRADLNSACTCVLCSPTSQSTVNGRLPPSDSKTALISQDIVIGPPPASVVKAALTSQSIVNVKPTSDSKTASISQDIVIGPPPASVVKAALTSQSIVNVKRPPSDAKTAVTSLNIVNEPMPVSLLKTTLTSQNTVDRPPPPSVLETASTSQDMSDGKPPSVLLESSGHQQDHTMDIRIVDVFSQAIADNLPASKRFLEDDGKRGTVSPICTQVPEPKPTFMFHHYPSKASNEDNIKEGNVPRPTITIQASEQVISGVNMKPTWIGPQKTSAVKIAAVSIQGKAKIQTQMLPFDRKETKARERAGSPVVSMQPSSALNTLSMAATATNIVTTLPTSAPNMTAPRSVLATIKSVKLIPAQNVPNGASFASHHPVQLKTIISSQSNNFISHRNQKRPPPLLPAPAQKDTPKLASQPCNSSTQGRTRPPPLLPATAQKSKPNPQHASQLNDSSKESHYRPPPMLPTPAQKDRPTPTPQLTSWPGNFTTQNEKRPEPPHLLPVTQKETPNPQLIVGTSDHLKRLYKNTIAIPVINQQTGNQDGSSTYVPIQPMSSANPPIVKGSGWQPVYKLQSVRQEGLAPSVSILPTPPTVSMVTVQKPVQVSTFRSGGTYPVQSVNHQVPNASLGVLGSQNGPDHHVYQFGSQALQSMSKTSTQHIPNTFTVCAPVPTQSEPKDPSEHFVFQFGSQALINPLKAVGVVRPDGTYQPEAFGIPSKPLLYPYSEHKTLDTGVPHTHKDVTCKVSQVDGSSQNRELNQLALQCPVGLPQQTLTKESFPSVPVAGSQQPLIRHQQHLLPQNQEFHRQNVHLESSEHKNVTCASTDLHDDGLQLTIIPDETLKAKEKTVDSSKRTLHLNSNDLSLVQSVIYQLFVEEAVVSLDNIHDRINSKISHTGKFFSYNKEELQHILRAVFRLVVKNDEYRFSKNLETGNFLSQVRSVKASKWTLVYIGDELFSNEDVVGTNQKGEQVAVRVLHAATQSGWLSNCLCFLQVKKDEVGNWKPIDPTEFELWCSELLLPNISEKSVVVIDSKPYHWRKFIKMSNRKDKKSSKSPKTQDKKSSARVTKNQDKKTKSKTDVDGACVIEVLAEEMGHIILKLPPYHGTLNPLTEAWSVVKSIVSSQQSPNMKIHEVMYNIEQAVAMTNSQSFWRMAFEGVAEEEEVFHKAELKLDETVDEMDTKKLAMARMSNSSQESCSSATEDETDFLEDLGRIQVDARADGLEDVQLWL